MKTRYVIQCKKHGVESKDWDGKQVVVSQPVNKKDRNESGCPYCKTEAAQQEPETAAA